MKAHHQFIVLMSQTRPMPECELFDIYVDIKPIGKGRPRGDEHRTPHKTRQWTDYVGACVAEQMAGKPAIDFPFCAKLIYAYRKRPPDMDNVEKIVWDALHRGDKSGRNRAFEDDRFLRGNVEVGELQSNDEFIWIRFYARRPEDATNYMREYNRDSDNVDF